MTFLAPLALWIAAAAVPALLILYFLKLRRREEPVPSTLLWRRAIQDLEVNAPFQRLRKNLLLLLQLLVLLLAILALARPMVETPLADESSIVMLIDRSASMNAVEPAERGRTRLELAREQAVRVVQSLNRTGSRWLSLFGAAPAQTRVMVIAFASTPTIVSPFTTNTADLVSLIEGIRPSDEPTNIREALELAEAYMMQTTVEQTPESAEETSAILLLSDGSFGDTRDFALQTRRVKLINVGQAEDNVGITALRYLRNYEQPDNLNVLLQVENFGPQPVETDVTLYIDGRIAAVRSLSLGAARPRDPQDSVRAADAGAETPARAQSDEGAAGSLSFEFVLPTGALIEARLSRDDALPLDNRAYVVVEPPRRQSVLLVSEKNFLLESVLQTLPLARFDYLTPAQYAAAPADRLESGGRSLYDVVVFDKFMPARLPGGNYLSFAAGAPFEEIELGESTGPQSFLWWDEAHAVLRYAAMEYVYVAEGRRLRVPREAQVLVEGPAGPAIARYARDGQQHLIVSFAVEQSNWWSKLSFGVFLQNSIRYLGGAAGGSADRPTRPGEPLRIALPAGTRSAQITRPDGRTVTVTPDELGMIYYADTSDVGVYRLEAGAERRMQFAVNLEDPAESDIRPGQRLSLGMVEVAQGQAIRTATPEIWRWFVGVALLIVLIEWVIYNRRVLI